MTNQRLWTTSELKLLRDNASLGRKALATLLERSEGSVRGAAQRLCISLRSRGSRRGLVLGQRRNSSLRVDMREDLVTGKADPALILRRMVDRDTALCPNCVMRPIEVERTGLCGDCHDKLYAEQHIAALEAEDARHFRDAARQRSHRARHKATS